MEANEKKKQIASIVVFIVVIAVIAGLAVLGIFMKKKENLAVFKDVKFIAHRGLSSKYYENSEEAFIGAARSDFFYGIETDIYFTKDEVAVCSHDDNAFKDINLKITTSNFEDIKDLSLKKDDYGHEKSGICRFERYLEICADYGKVAVIELKQPSLSNERINRIMEAAKTKCGNNIVVISFFKENIEAIKAKDSNIKTQYLVSGENRTRALLEGYDVSDYFRCLTKKHVDEAHGIGKQIGAWTINNIDEARRYAEYGVDYITTDHDFLAEL